MVPASDPVTPLEIGFFLVIAGGTALRTAWKRMTSLRAIEDTPRSDIGSAPQGLVEIEGHVFPYGQASSTLENEPTAYRKLVVEKRVTRGKTSSWEALLDEASGDWVVVSDGTGLALVVMDGAELLVTETVREWGKLPAEARRHALDRWGGLLSGLSEDAGWLARLGAPRVRFREQALRVGAPIYVRGAFRTDRDRPDWKIDPVRLRFLGRIAEMRKDPSMRKRAFDINRDGVIDERELAFGSSRLLAACAAEAKPDEPVEPVALQGIIVRGETHSLLVGDCFQPDLVRRLRWSRTMIFAGVVAIAAGLGLLAQFLAR